MDRREKEREKERERELDRQQVIKTTNQLQNVREIRRRSVDTKYHTGFQTAHNSKMCSPRTTQQQNSLH